VSKIRSSQFLFQTLKKKTMFGTCLEQSLEQTKSIKSSFVRGKNGLFQCSKVFAYISLQFFLLFLNSIFFALKYRKSIKSLEQTLINIVFIGFFLFQTCFYVWNMFGTKSRERRIYRYWLVPNLFRTLEQDKTWK
jgi:hypothetical protein